MTFRQTIECAFTLVLVRDMIITYSLRLIFQTNLPLKFLTFISLEARAQKDHREEYWERATPKSFIISRKSFDSRKNPFISKCVGVQF